MDDKYIIDNFIKKDGGFNIRKIRTDQEALNYVNTRYVDSTNIYESIYRIRHNLEVRPVCATCGKPLDFKGCFTTYCSNTCQRKNPNNKTKYEQTCLAKYGTTNPAKSQQVIEKAKQTCRERYGGNSPATSKKIILKQNNTKRKNHTFNTSIPEKVSYDILKGIYSDVKYQYYSEDYPFECDFYIPSLDLYIECNYHWTHGGHVYDSVLDREKYEDWVERAKTNHFYRNAVETWTIRDVKKRSIAKENRLNYIEFWTINELKIWVENYSI